MIRVEDLEEVKEEIEKVRKKLEILLSDTSNYSSGQILEISKDLDKLIVKYFKTK